MKLSKVYNQVAEHYDQSADNFGLIPVTHRAALSQLMDVDWNNKNILDLGVGSGEFLLQLKQKFPQSKMTGVDISEQMLKIAKTKFELTTICSPLQKVDRHLPHYGFDLVVAHYVLAYVGTEVFLEKAKTLMKPGGYISLVTTTLESFAASQKFFEEKLAKKSIVTKCVNYFYGGAMRNTHVPKSYSELQSAVEKNGFSIVKHERINKEFYFKNLKETMGFWMHGGWIASGADSNIFPAKVFYFLLFIYLRFTVTFPFRDHFISDVILLKKN